MVLDSNVLISGLVFSRGNPAHILELLRNGEIGVCISEHIIEEISRSFLEDFDWGESRVQEAIGFLHSHCEPIDAPAETALGSLTPADNRILDCAFRGGVDYLVTGDKSLQRVGSFQGIPIVSPAAFIEIFHRNSAQ